MKYITEYKVWLTGLIFVLHSINVQAQQQEEEIEIKVVKNALTVRPISALSGLFGLSYERYIKNGYSAVLYMDYEKGPAAMSGSYNKWIQSNMNANYASISYEGYAIVPEVRRYFYKNDPDASLVGLKDQGSLAGWFVGIYLPIRKTNMNMSIVTEEEYAYARQLDTGTVHLNSWMYGLGVEGGKHWILGNFSIEIMAGLSYSTGIASNQQFTYTRYGIGEYIRPKDIGLISTYSHWVPRFGINLGLAF